MKQFFRAYQDWLLAFVSFLLIGVIIGYYIWGIKTLTVSFSDALFSEDTQGANAEFNLEGARALQLE